MKAFGMWTVLSTLLPITQVSLPFAAAEPIPAEVRVHSLRSAQQGVEIVEETNAKRALDGDLFGEDGLGPRYWAWSKLAYDDAWNSDQNPRPLEGGQDQKWAKLAGDEITVRGFAGPRLSPGMSPWDTFTGMKIVVGKDSSKQVIVMAFIGSNDIPTAEQDLKFPLIKRTGIEGEIEKGFAQCYEAVAQKAFQWTKEWADETGWDIVITGHSLGGATAHVAAVGFAASHPDLAGRTTVFTYGAPRAGNLAFQQKLAANQGDRMANFRHKHDLVPYLPFIHMAGSTYANAGSRYIFTGGPSWFDGSKWTKIANPDEETERRTGIVATAASALHKFDEHTGYFSSSTPGSKRDIGLGDGSQPEPSLHKRETPTGQDLQAADGSIGNMRQSNELRNTVTLTPNLQKFIDAMNIEGERQELLDELNNGFTDEKSRVDLLRAIEIFGAEQ